MSKKNNTKIIWTGFIWRVLLLTLLFIIGYSIFFFVNLNKNINKSIALDKSSAQNNSTGQNKKIESLLTQPLKGEKNNRINILLLGLDGGSRKSGTYLTDTIALVSINPKTYRSAILSIPRDLYVQIPHSNYHTKINALYTYGLKNKQLSPGESVDLIRSAVEEITGEKIPYYVIIDFAGFKKIIKILNGIEIEVPQDIKDTRYPGPNYSYETFEIKKGWHHLDAETALKYARVRHTQGGDFGRAKRQQQIIAAVKKKALSLKILANPLKTGELLKTLGEHLKTNITKPEIFTLLKLAKNINIHQTTTKVLDAWSKDSLLKSTHIPLGGVYAYVLIPKIKSYAEIQNLSKNIFDLKKLDQNKEEIKKENAQISILTSPSTLTISFINILHQWDYSNIKRSSQLNKKVKQLCNGGEDRLISFSGKTKLFTLNDLADKLNISVTYNNQFSSTKNKNQPDILLCLTKPTVNFFTDLNKDTSANKNSKQTILNKEGEVLINRSDSISSNSTE